LVFLHSNEKWRNSSSRVTHVKDTSDLTRNLTGKSLWYQRYATKSRGNVSMWIVLVPSRFKKRM
jgi:hypothetical protein